MSQVDREMYAAFAMQGMLAHATRYRPPGNYKGHWHDFLAKEAFEIADAMVRENIMKQCS